MTAPTISQMMWGGPTLRTQFEMYYENTQRALIIYLNNPPRVKRIWRFLGVRRETIQSLTAEFRISEIGTNRIIVPIRHARIYSDDDPTDLGKDRIVLPPTFSVGACIAIIYWDTAKNEAKIMLDRLRPLITIAPGYYQITIIFFIDGLPKNVVRKFVVGDKPDDLMWVNTKTKRICLICGKKVKKLLSGYCQICWNRAHIPLVHPK